VNADVRDWFERAWRDTPRLEIEDLMRIVVLLERNPSERDEGIAQLSDGELAFLFRISVNPVEDIFEGIRSGRVEVHPPDARIVFTAETLAEVGTVRESAVLEIARRLGEL
jgi:hypothetical protein